MQDDKRGQLVALYAELAAHTEPECAGSCERPLTCCEERYCSMAIDFARQHWGVDLSPTWHRALPLMGASGCTAEPHLRPICAAHTCEICLYGEKRGDQVWTARYHQVLAAIRSLEEEILGEAFV